MRCPEDNCTGCDLIDANNAVADYQSVIACGGGNTEGVNCSQNSDCASGYWCVASDSTGSSVGQCEHACSQGGGENCDYEGVQNTGFCIGVMEPGSTNSNLVCVQCDNGNDCSDCRIPHFHVLCYNR